MAAIQLRLGRTPRAQASALWRFDEDADELLVQASCPVRADVLGELISESEVPTAEVGSEWRIDVEFNCQRTPPSDVPVELRPILKQAGRCYRSRKVVVPEADRHRWCTNRLDTLGFYVTAGSLEVGPLAYADLGRRGGGIPYVRVQATGTVTDADTWNQAIRDGIGRGRSFGLGLARVQLITEGAMA